MAMMRSEKVNQTGRQPGWRARFSRCRRDDVGQAVFFLRETIKQSDICRLWENNIKQAAIPMSRLFNTFHVLNWFLGPRTARFTKIGWTCLHEVPPAMRPELGAGPSGSTRWIGQGLWENAVAPEFDMKNSPEFECKLLKSFKEHEIHRIHRIHSI